MSIPIIIDEIAHRRNRTRAAKAAGPQVDFLLRHAAADLVERLSLISRTFETAVNLCAIGRVMQKSLEDSGQCQSIYSSGFIEEEIKGSAAVLSRDDHVAFSNNSCDLAVSGLSLQFINDIPGFLVQVRRTLKADGLFMASFIGGKSLTELRQSFVAAEAEVSGSAHSRVMPFIDVREAGGLLQRTGFALPVADSDLLTVRYETAFDLMRDLRSMGAQNCLKNRQKGFLRRDVVARMAEFYADNFSDEDGRIRATFEIISLSGWVPHESQQKPLKPGTAKISLKDALKAQGE